MRTIAGLLTPRTRARRSEAEYRLYQHHRWRSEGFHGEAKIWHGLARAVRRGLQNMRIQAFLTAAAINLKRLDAALLDLLHTLAGRLSQAITETRAFVLHVRAIAAANGTRLT